MASSRIPSPLNVEDDPVEDDLDAPQWLRGQGRPLRHHATDAPGTLHRQAAWPRVIHLNVGNPLDYELLVDDMIPWEGEVPFMYLDKKGLVTVGIGNLLKTVESAKPLPFVNMMSGKPATEQEIVSAYSAVSQLPPAQKRRTYKLSPSIELTREDYRALARRRLEREFVPGLRGACPMFDTYPPSAQRFMIDMAYNGGVGFFKKRHMVEQLTQRDWLGALLNVPTRSRPARRVWRETMLRKAAVEDA